MRSQLPWLSKNALALSAAARFAQRPLQRRQVVRLLQHLEILAHRVLCTRAVAGGQQHRQPRIFRKSRVGKRQLALVKRATAVGTEHLGVLAIAAQPRVHYECPSTGCGA